MFIGFWKLTYVVNIPYSMYTYYSIVGNAACADNLLLRVYGTFWGFTAPCIFIGAMSHYILIVLFKTFHLYYFRAVARGGQGTMPLPRIGFAPYANFRNLANLEEAYIYIYSVVY